ncbi:hypothetical protein [Priestia flexa]|uniref:hypothetical protein n=1 Tax=Priestia flexa TaxID=86664 RepID=UPI00099C8FA1|nr:hypothetical protein [Priestia flexa]AQX56039.1 hypothetical protein BC359_18165 [Priestia flexa]
MLTLGKCEELFNNGEIDKSKLIVARGEQVKAALDPTSKEMIDARLRSKYTPEEVDAIWTLEELYLDTLKTRQAGLLFEVYFPIIQEASVMYEKKYAGYRVSRHDFESAFFMEFRRLLSIPKTNPKFTFYETFKRSLSFRAKDVARRESGMRNKQRKFEIEAIPIENHHESEIFEGVIVPDRSSMEERLEAKEAVKDIFESKELTEDERRLLFAMNDNPEASFRDLAKTCDFHDHKKVKRVLDSIRYKMKEFNPFN